jgi:hypothetical protein
MAVDHHPAQELAAANIRRTLVQRLSIFRAHTRAGTDLIDSGRGVYFRDPDGHYLEVITRPYGSGG